MHFFHLLLLWTKGWGSFIGIKWGWTKWFCKTGTDWWVVGDCQIYYYALNIWGPLKGKNIFVSQVFSGCASGYITFNASGCWETVCGTETSSRISVSMFFTFFSLIGVLLDWLCSLAIYFSSCLRYGEQDYVVGLAQFHPSRFLQALDILMELNCWIFYTLLLPNFLAFWLKF